MENPTPVPYGRVFFSFALVDYLLVGGLSILAFAFFLTPYGAGLDSAAAQTLILALAWVGNAPHFSATHYRLYRSRATMRQFPYTAFLAPLAVALGVWASLVYPARISPYFIKLYLLWSPYHYSGQAVGLTVLYARRSGFRLSRPMRWTLSAFVYGTFVTAAARVEAGLTKLSYFGIVYPTLGLPKEIPQAAELLMAVAGVTFLILLAFRSLWERRLPSPILLVPAAAHFVWFIPGPSVGTFFALIPFFHGIQYLLVAGYLQLNERGRTTEWRWFRISREVFLWTAFNVLGGFCLLRWLPQAVAMSSNLDPLFVLPVVIAGVQIHHFFVDGVVWKLRNPRVSSLLDPVEPQDEVTLIGEAA
jgi:hypothetical protein